MQPGGDHVAASAVGNAHNGVHSDRIPGTYWEVRKLGNQHVAEASRRSMDGGGPVISRPLHQVIAGDLIEVRRELRAKGATLSDLKPTNPDAIEVWLSP